MSVMLGRRTFLLTSVSFASLAASGCTDGLLGGVAGPPADLYTLTPKSTFDPDLPTVGWQLVVEEPIASGGLNIARIALRDDPTRLDYFKGVRWTERAPEMVQTLLVESFENTGKIVSVGRQTLGLRSDYNLKTELREFQAEFDGAAAVPTIRVRLNAKIIKQPRRKIIASKNFESKIVADGSSMQDIIHGYDTALGKVMRHVVEWTLVNAQ
jgi:cholesterol transport system auxiliary component